MKVVLVKDVKKLGFAGDIVEVARGYFNAYLSPNGSAVLATVSSMRNAQVTQAKRIKGKEEMAAKSGEIAAMLQKLTLRFSKKVSSGSHLYGSVGEADIASELKKQAKITIEKSQIHLPEHIKELGTYDVPVHLAGEVTVHVKVEVVEEKGKEKAAPAKKKKAAAKK